jgi:putative molybdenum carrier protein
VGVLAKLISGGQTGVDRAALDVALALGLPCGGWCPRGRRAEDGRIDERYPLHETPSADYAQRTEWNVRDSDGTLVLTKGEPRGGTAFTVDVARDLGRPALVVDLAGAPDAAAVGVWLRREGIRVLNVAGPRESGAPGIHEEAVRFLRAAFGP